MTPGTKFVIYSIIALMIISHEINYRRQTSAAAKSVEQYSKHSSLKPLPKQFSMKLVTVINATPSEVANALADETQRPLWEPKLKEVKKEENGMLSLQYVGYTTQYQRGFSFENLDNNLRQRRFLINENVLINRGQN